MKTPVRMTTTSRKEISSGTCHMIIKGMGTHQLGSIKSWVISPLQNLKVIRFLFKSNPKNIASLNNGDPEDLERKREELKKYIMRSIINEELNSNDEQQKSNYKHIYASKIKNVSGYGGLAQDRDNYRTESF